MVSSQIGSITFAAMSLSSKQVLVLDYHSVSLTSHSVG